MDTLKVFGFILGIVVVPIILYWVFLRLTSNKGASAFFSAILVNVVLAFLFEKMSILGSHTPSLLLLLPIMLVSVIIVIMFSQKNKKK